MKQINTHKHITKLFLDYNNTRNQASQYINQIYFLYSSIEILFYNTKQLWNP